MPSPDPHGVFTQKFEALGLRYMVTGSVAAMFFGEPRLTNDVDVVVHLTREDVDRLATAFPEDDFYVPPREVIECERRRATRGHFNLIHHGTGLKADVYLASADAFHDWGLAHAVRVNTDEGAVTFAPPPYVIVRKLQFYREGSSEKHLRDVRGMLLALGDDLDRPALERWIDHFGLESEWNAAVLGLPRH